MTPAAMSDKEFVRYGFRAGLFERRGMDPDAVMELAYRLVSRDAERDDRRACAECAHFQFNRRREYGNRCFVAAKGAMHGTSVRHDPHPSILQRCDHFQWQKP